MKVKQAPEKKWAKLIKGSEQQCIQGYREVVVKDMLA